MVGGGMDVVAAGWVLEPGAWALPSPCPQEVGACTTDQAELPQLRSPRMMPKNSTMAVLS